MVCKTNAAEDADGDIAMEDQPNDILMENSERSLEDIAMAYAAAVQEHFNHLNELLAHHVRSDDCFADLASQLPRISSPLLWLAQLRSGNFEVLQKDWKTIIIRFGLAVTELSRANRLVNMINTGQNREGLAEELNNIGHTNWDPYEFPETLLFEAENGIIVREAQENVASKMRHPPDGNSVMQLAMGEGKTSVILPIVAARLANGNRIVRCVVGKAQFREMEQILRTKLGGLLNRQVFPMPFSRATKPTKAEAKNIHEIAKECGKTGGIMLMQPEHILSFKLMSIECIHSGQTELGKKLLDTQIQLFEALSRDIVDECDDAFSVKTDVVFPVGLPAIIEMGPERWHLTQNIMSLLIDYIREVKRTLPSSIEVDYRRDRGFPRARIQRDDAADRLQDLMANKICEKGLPGLAIHQQPPPIRQAIRNYICNLDLTSHDINLVESSEFWSHQTTNALYILRGLLAESGLVFSLRSKKWRVNYGADPTRIPKIRLVVPFRSKDNPSARSEFNSPELVIVLTLLHYYYQGLNDEDLFNVFDHLSKSDDADVEYGRWRNRVTDVLPEEYRSLSGINLKDHAKCTKIIFSIYRYEKLVIDYFLGNLVFPKEMRQYLRKLAASGWDLGAHKHYPTTGFSGTADLKHILPLNMKHIDLEDHNHTNALVLMRILHNDNSVKIIPRQDPERHTSNAEYLLHFVNSLEEETRVIIDVGAQILEFDNREVAETWMQINKVAKGVVYFDENDELVVRDRQGRIELLQTSPFANELGDCLVYLDESHTRGTDLKLPLSYRAAVFLGPDLTKDRLAQACMRLRKLGQGQTMVLCITQEILMRIIERSPGKHANNIQVSDVLQWTINETWAETRRSMPMWATQGRRFVGQSILWENAGTKLNEDVAEQFLENDTITIKDRYGPRVEDNSISSYGHLSNPDLARIYQRCQDLKATSIGAVGFDEERERELNPEVEVDEERLVQREKLAPIAHKLSDEIVQIVNTSKIPNDPKDLIPAFQALQCTSVAQYYDLHKLPASLLVTTDFIRTVKIPAGKKVSGSDCDSYLKTVQWLLSVKEDAKEYRTLIIISAYEADELFPRVLKSKSATLHVYAPRTIRAHNPLDSLDRYCVGAGKFLKKEINLSDMHQLNLFAGQLYLSSYQDYSTLCRHLNLNSRPKNYRAAKDGFLTGQRKDKWNLESSPVEFLLQLMKMRDRGRT